ncbi:MAG: class I SAM-dependent methyltransferase family protein [Thermoplasmata archaeon]
MRVPRERGEAVRHKAHSLGLLDTKRKIVERQGYLEIPMTAIHPSLRDLGKVVEQEKVVWARKSHTPHQQILDEASIPHDLKAFVPRRWEKIGDVLLLRFPRELRPYQEEVCRAYARVLRVKTVLDASQGIEGEWRRPRVAILWGEETETVHKENGVLYKLDLSEVMFSSGNIDERVRMSRVCRPGEVVVDMFAGIGYFSLPMAVWGRPSKVYACEVNPVAYAYLKENIRMNQADAVEPILGDCREVAPRGVADRVVLGYLRDTHEYLPDAIQVLRGEGWIHYHEACPDETAHRLPEYLIKAAEKEGMMVVKLEQRRVKSYAPGVYHWVVDALISQAAPPPSRSP